MDYSKRINIVHSLDAVKMLTRAVRVITLRQTEIDYLILAVSSGYLLRHYESHRRL